MQHGWQTDCLPLALWHACSLSACLNDHPSRDERGQLLSPPALLLRGPLLRAAHWEGEHRLLGGVGWVMLWPTHVRRVKSKDNRIKFCPWLLGPK